MKQTQLLVIGAGPYALSAAALARERGIGTVVLGQPMGFWRENMPAGMFLRSGPDWHLDGAGRHTFQAYLDEQAIKAEEIDPIPVGVFLNYAGWFRKTKGIGVREEFVDRLVKADGRFEARLRGGDVIQADAVVAAGGGGAVAERFARLRTSAATTAKPLPCSPARAASTAAFKDSKFVWKAMSSMIPMMAAISVEDSLMTDIA